MKSYVMNHSNEQTLPNFLFPLFLLIIALSATIWGWHSLNTSAYKTTYEQFDLRVERLKFAIESRMIAYEHVLRGGESLFAAIGNVTRQDWKEYVRNLKTHEYFPGVRAIGFSQRIFHNQINQHVTQMQQEGFPSYHIYPTPYNRDEYMPVTYLEPWIAGYQNALGFDAYSDPKRRQAAQLACDTGKATITDKINLILQENGKPLEGFVMYLPIYQNNKPLDTIQNRREALVGFVSSGFRIEEVMHNVLGEMDEQDIDFRIYDGDKLIGNHLLYDEPTFNDSPNSQYQPQFTKTVALNIAQHPWTLQFISLPKFDKDTDQHSPDFLLFGGLFVSLLLFGLTWSLSTAQQFNSRLQIEITHRRGIEERLRNREEILRLIIDSIPQSIFWKDLRHIYLGCNHRFALAVGLNSPQEIIGKKELKLPWKNPQVFDAIDRRVIETDLPEYHLIQKIQTSSGEIRWIDTSRIPLHEASGEVMGILVTYEDVTAQKEAEIELQKSREAERQATLQLKQFKTTLDLTLDGVFIREAKTLKLSYVNRGILELLGYTEEEFSRLNLEDLNPQVTPEYLSQLLADIRDHPQTSRTFETVHKRKDGQFVPIEVSLQYIEIPYQNSRFIGIVRNITERKQAEEALLRAKEEAEMANQAKSAFLANMSHELRTPLNGILGYAQILNRDKTLTDKQLQGVQVIERSGEYLLTLINDILDLSKIEAGKVEIYPTDFNFGDFLQGITDLFKMRTQQKGIAFIYEPLSYLPTGIRGDEKRLRQILINLIGNAVKFTEKGGVNLKVSYHDGQVLFQIEDTGIGIPEDQTEKIFLPFQQVGNSNYHHEGTGLGLSITQKLIEMMGGKLQVKSVLEEGSTFWFHLKLPDVSNLIIRHQKVQDPVIVGFIGKPRKILIVDDRWENRSVLVNLLTPLGFVVDEVHNGKECLEQLPKSNPDMIITDLVMPIMDGFEMVRQIRKLSQWDHLPIIAASASVFEDDQQQSLDVGCNDFIAKPIRADLLLKSLQKNLQLTWIYEENNINSELTENETFPSAEKVEITVKPTQKQLTSLLDLAMMGDIGGIIEFADEMGQSNQALLPFVQKVQQLARNFEEQQLTELIQSYVQQDQ